MMIASPGESGDPDQRNRVHKLIAECRQRVELLKVGLAGGEVMAGDLARIEEMIKTIATEAASDPNARKLMLGLCEALSSAERAGAEWMARVAVPQLEAIARVRTGTEIYRQRGRRS